MRHVMFLRSWTVLVLGGLFFSAASRAQSPTQSPMLAPLPQASNSQFAAEYSTSGTSFATGVIMDGPFQPPVSNLEVQTLPAGSPALVEDSSSSNIQFNFDWKHRDSLFHYSWVDFGEGHGLRAHRLEWTNAWADFRAPDFFTRTLETNHDFNAGLSFNVQWWKERPRPKDWPYGSTIPPPVLYDLYLDLGWRAVVAPGWTIDVAVSPGLSTDFRVTPPDAFRIKGHALTMVEILPTLRGVLGLWYLNRNSTKLLPVGGLVWQATSATRLEAVFPQPRLVHELGCWKNRDWNITLGGEFGGGGWAFKNPEGTKEAIDYRDFRALAGLHWRSGKGEGWFEVGYIFERDLRYAQHQGFGYEPGNAIMLRVGHSY